MTPESEAPPSRWMALLEEVDERRRLSLQMGGEEQVRRQHDKGKTTVRERIDLLLDADSFREVGAIAGSAAYSPDGQLASFQPSNTIVGLGKIDGRPVVVEGDDFTIRGGAGDAGIEDKLRWAEQFANEHEIPLVRLVESSGGSVRALEDIGRTYVPANPAWEWVVANLSRIPVVAVALGPCAGLSAARLVASHYSVMVEATAQVFVAGPPLVAAIGETVTKEELGGADVHARNGVVTDAVASESEAIDRVRAFLSYLPARAGESPPIVTSSDPSNRHDEALRGVVPEDARAPFKIRPVIESIMDEGSFLELGCLYGRSLVAGFARLAGRPVAVLANDPYFYGGAMTAAAARKLEHMVDLATLFGLPVVNLVDQPGFAIGLEHERAGTIRAGVRALNAVYQTAAPWCTVILRRCFGVAGAAHRNASRATHRVAWPSASWGSLRLEGGVQAAYRREIEDAEDPAEAEARIVKRLTALGSPVRTAEAFGIEEIIDPAHTRQFLCGFAELAYNKTTAPASSWSYRG